MSGYYPVEGDICVTADGRRFALTDGVDACRQFTRVASTALLGSYVYDQRFGFPLEDILAARTVESVRAIVSEWLDTLVWIIDVTRLDVTIDAATRVCSITWDGIVDVDGTATGVTAETIALGVAA